MPKAGAAMQYVVVYEQTPNNWGAYVPDLPGCVAVADTREEVEGMIREAAELYIEMLIEDREAVPEPGSWTGTIDVQVTQEQSRRT